MFGYISTAPVGNKRLWMNTLNVLYTIDANYVSDAKSRAQNEQIHHKW